MDKSIKDSLDILKEETRKMNDYASDEINHPKHYISANGIETIDVIEAFTENLIGIEATDTGNIIKYISRWKKKNGVQDLKKAKWYLEHLIEHVETDEKNYISKNIL